MGAKDGGLMGDQSSAVFRKTKRGKAMELAFHPFDRRTPPPPSPLSPPLLFPVPLEATCPGRRAGLIENGEESELLLLLLAPSPYPLAASIH